MKKRTSWAVWLPLLLSLALGLGIFLGTRLGPSWRAVDAEALRLREVMRLIDRHYVDEVRFPHLGKGAIDHMLALLDPHTSHTSRQASAWARENLGGRFEGIGIEFDVFDDTVYVMRVLDEGPSVEAGLRAGDRILEVGDAPLVGVAGIREKVIGLLRGPEGTRVCVRVARGMSDSLQQVCITRARVPLRSVEVAYMLDSITGYVRIEQFTSSVHGEFVERLRVLEKAGMRRLVIDLRGNTGGYLHAAIQVVDALLEKEALIVSTRGRSRPEKKYYAEKAPMLVGFPIIALVDKRTASAAEIALGAWQDHDRAWIVGQASFGKGLVQDPITLRDGSELRLTVARYYTPSGRSLQKPYERALAADTLSEAEQSVKRFYTDKGREVGEQGGIVPDVEIAAVPLPAVLRALRASGILQKQALRYHTAHKDLARPLGLAQASDSLSRASKVLAGLYRALHRIDTVIQLQHFEAARGIILRHFRAEVLRMAHGEGRYAKALASSDSLLQKARRYFPEAQALLKP